MDDYVLFSQTYLDFSELCHWETMSFSQGKDTVYQSSEPQNLESPNHSVWPLLAAPLAHLSWFFNWFFLYPVISIRVYTCCVISVILKISPLFTPIPPSVPAPFSPFQISKAPWKNCQNSLFRPLSGLPVISTSQSSSWHFSTVDTCDHFPWNIFFTWLSDLCVTVSFFFT